MKNAVLIVGIICALCIVGIGVLSSGLLASDDSSRGLFLMNFLGSFVQAGLGVAGAWGGSSAIGKDRKKCKRAAIFFVIAGVLGIHNILMWPFMIGFIVLAAMLWKHVETIPEPVTRQKQKPVQKLNMYPPHTQRKRPNTENNSGQE